MSRFRLFFGGILGVMLLFVGCVTPSRSLTRSSVAPKQVHRLHLEPIKVIASGGGARIEVLDAMGLFEAGGRYLAAKQYRQALRHYDRLLHLFPKSHFTSPALYNAGLAHEALYEYDKAAARYRTMIRNDGTSRDAIDATFRLGGCLAELHRWRASAQVFASVLKRRDLSAGDRIEAYAREGLAYFRLHDDRATQKTLRAAVAYARRIDGVERLDNDFFLGMAYYYLAAIPHVLFRQSKVATDQSMGKTLDAKAKLLLQSQRRYIETIRVKNPYWATAAGFQIGSLYREFYDTLMTALPDFKKVAKKNAKRAKISIAKAERQLVTIYLEELHKRVKPLLKKAIRVFEKNVVMGTRVGIHSRWVAKSRRQIQELRRLLLVKPAEAVKLRRAKPSLPEDQPGIDPPAASRPTTGAPPASSPSSAPETPGRRVLM